MDVNDFLAGLKALAESAFPKRCANCGHVFETPESFLRETRAIREGQTGLKQSWDDDDMVIVEAYRNCICGSTLMDFFTDRRDVSESGLKRRARFQQLIEYLAGQGITSERARLELLRVLRGEKSEILRSIRPPG
ncbi:oxidoreductase [Chitinivorax sp. B]|uniref:oxidoreductase n=1 Tax=Chitinivorax sp. B TaxID=2502235 RepID=UPI0010F6FEDB|nr:oxidoreductase [Chitinivorax sp. B]